MPALLEIKNVVKNYDGKTPVLEGVSLELNKGEVIVLIGPSGCGKSTLLRCINGLEAIQAGEICLEGKAIDYNKKDLTGLRQKIGMVFQSYELFPHMTILDNIILAPTKVAGVDRENAKREAMELLEKVGLAHKAKAYPRELSGGQKQRVAIARAVVNKPSVLLLDEPLGALDLMLRRQMQTELKKLQKALGITFIYITHDQEEALAMSDWIFVMNDGEIVQSGTPVDIYDEPINHFVATFIGESNILPGKMIEDYLVEFNGERFEAVDGGMRPNESVEVVIRPEDLRITLPEEGKLQVKVDTQLFRGVHYEIIAYDELGNEWMIHSTRKAIVGEEIGLHFEPEDIHIMRLNETEEEFDARIEEYVEVEEQEAGLINAIEEERDEENNL